MKKKSPTNLIVFGEEVLNLLHRTRTVSTYKYAVLLGIIDLCMEHNLVHDGDKESITTRQLAEKVMALYWPQTLPYKKQTDSPPLKQNSGNQAKILSLIIDFKKHLGDGSVTLSKAILADKDEYEKTVREIEWTLIHMPLPKLQRVDHASNELLYSIGWDDNVKRGQVSEYQRAKPSSDFDNLIRLQHGVADNLASLSSLLRPLIHNLWMTQVAHLNKKKLEDSQLEEYLFGASRIPLTPIKNRLRDIHKDECFYCGGKLPNSYEVDHFIPWARYPDNGIGNLVVADRKCNGNKSDFLASEDHLEKWRDHIDETSDDRIQLARDKKWEGDMGRTTGVATTIYSALTGDASLWQGIDRFASAKPERIRSILGGFR